MNTKRNVLLLVISLLGISHAQVSTTGEIRGRVLDPTEAGVPRAQLKLIDEATSLERTATSAEDGGFVFLRLTAGPYRITATAPGFQTTVSPGVVVETARTVDVVIRMTVGSVTETIEVSGAAAVLETSSSTLSTTIRNETLHALPLSGRDLLSFALMSPGAARGSSDRNSTFNGLPNASLNITLDGVNNNSQRFKSGGTSNFVFAPLRLGAIEEVTVQTAGVGADASGEGAMQMRFVTKRGSNQWHGSAFEQFRNNALNANTWFNNAAGLRRPTLRLNEFGGNVGGPILRNRLFFFINHEELRQPQQTLFENTILTMEAQQGIFRYRGTDNVERTVNLLQAAGMAGHTSQINPIMANILSTQNGTRSRGNVVTQDLFRERIQWNRFGGPTERYPTARFDYQIAPNLSASGTWNLRWRDIRPSAPWPGLPEQSRFRSTYYVGSVGLNWTIRPTILNEFRIGQQHNPELFNVGEEARQFDLGGRLATIANPTGLGVDPLVRAQLPIPRNNPVWNLYDNMNLVRGNHTLTLGGSMLRTSQWEATYFPSGIPALSLGIDGTDPVANVIRNALPSARTEDQTNALNVYALLTGRLNGISSTRRLDENDKQYRDGSPRVLRELMTTWGLYVQDSWRLRPTLTLNFGLRWEFSGAVENTNGTYTSPTLADLYGPSSSLFAPGVLDGVASPQIPVRPKPYNRDYLNPAPNFGFAWNPQPEGGILRALLGNRKTVVRGSFGLSYYQEGLNAFNSYAGNNPGLNQSVSLSPNQPGFAPGSLNVSSPLPQLITFPTSFSAPFPMSLFTYTNTNLSTMLPNLRTPYVTNWSFGVQREIGTTALEVRYVGNKGTHIWHGFNINEVNIFENGFLREFQSARNNLNINTANGSPNTFENRGLPGQAALPIFDAAFGARGSLAAVTAAQGYGNTNFLNQLREGQAGALANGLTGTSGLYLCRMVGNRLPYCQSAGVPGPYPINFFQVNPFNSNSLMRLQTDYSYSSYNGLQIEVRRRARGLYFTANYTFSKSLGDLFAESDVAFQNFTTLRDRKLDKAPSVFDIRHAALASATYDLPFGQGRRFAPGNRIADRIIGGWTIGVLTRIQSGRPFRLSSGRSTVNQSDSGVILNGLTASELQDKLTIRPGPNRNISFVDESLVAADGRANASILGPASNPGEFGQFIYLYGPKFVSNDMSLMKSIPITERFRTELLVEALNVFNHPVFGATGGQGNSVNITGTTFGQTTSTAVQPRNLQLRLVVRF